MGIMLQGLHCQAIAVLQELEQAVTRAIADAGSACVVLSHTYVSFVSLLVLQVDNISSSLLLQRILHHARTVLEC
jgi:hypothetical protein